MLLLLMRSGGRWQPGIGDPTIMGWVTVFAYAYAGAVCYQASRAAHYSAHSPAVPVYTRLAICWLGLALLLMALGINKQLDLQSWLTQLAKDMAHAQGWYEDRRRVQIVFIEGILVAFTVATGSALWWLRNHLQHMRLALLGTGFLITFVVVRAASFHYVDVLLYRSTGSFQLNWLFELGGIALIATNAMRERRKKPY